MKGEPVNTCIITGNLGDDPEMVVTENEKQIATFSLAFKSGKDKTSWIKVSCFDRLAEVAVQYLHKGARVVVTATLDQNKWETENGEPRSNHRLLANTIEFVKTDGRGFDGEEAPF